MRLNDSLSQARSETGEQGFLQQNKHHEQWESTQRKMHLQQDQKVTLLCSPCNCNSFLLPLQLNF